MFKTLTIILFISASLFGNVFIAPGGSDNNTGTIDSPLATITAALNKIQPGDTMYMRGGAYIYTATVSISKSGTAEKNYHLFAYDNERPLLDFSSMEVGSSNRGINLSGNFWFIKGINIKGAGDNGMIIRGSGNRIEFCSFFENRDTGLQLAGGASNNNIINCDSYFNADPGNGNADGFAPKLDAGTGNYFYGCRAWQNSDDGWDGYLRGSDDIKTTLENCWCFANGYLKDGSSSSGNGNGYKMGGGDNSNSEKLAHDFTILHSIAFDNRVKGFDQNNNRGSMKLYNCTAYRNGTNYSLPLDVNSGELAEIVNCAVPGEYGSIALSVEQKTNSWMSGFVVTSADFISADTAGVRGARKADGSLPDINFLHLAAGSDLIDAGTNINIPYTGNAPDLGAFEYGAVNDVIKDKLGPASFVLEQNYPNPFNPVTVIKYTIPAGNVVLKLYDLAGKEVSVLVNEYHDAGTYSVNYDASEISSGIYFYKITINSKEGNFSTARKMAVIK